MDRSHPRCLGVSDIQKMLEGMALRSPSNTQHHLRTVCPDHYIHKYRHADPDIYQAAYGCALYHLPYDNSRDHVQAACILVRP